MRAADAPPVGWYPDPEGGSRLRWWDGSDWSGHYRLSPSQAPPSVVGGTAGGSASGSAQPGWYRDPAGGPRPRWWDGLRWTEQFGDPSQLAGQAGAIVDQVRQATRAEVDRAAAIMSARARSTVQDLTPLITEYTNRFSRFVRRVVIVAVVLAIAWFVFQAWANMSFFEWLGDRIDNLSDESGSAAAVWRLRSPT